MSLANTVIVRVGGHWHGGIMVRGKYRVQVISGELKGRLLHYPAAKALRPTMQRTKASVFDTLGDTLRGAVFVDLYSGAGGVGIEALSRGADFVCFVEENREALDFLRRNLDSFAVGSSRYAIHGGDVGQFVKSSRLASLNPDIIYADPPYRDADVGLLLELLAKIVYSSPVLTILEHPAGASFKPDVRFAKIREKSFGQTSVSFFSSAREGDRK